MHGLHGLLLVLRNAFQRTLRGWRLVILLVLASVPVVLTAIAVSASDRFDIDEHLTTLLLVVLQVTVPFAALYLGTAVLGDEIEGRTITYLYTRPLPRPVFYLGRLLGFTCAFGVILTAAVYASAFLAKATTELSAREVAGSAAIAVGGFAVYAAFFAALRAYFRRALYIGFLLTFIFEITISKIPVAGITRISVWHHLALFTARLFEGRVPHHDLLGTVKAEETVGGAITVLACVFLVSLVAGCWVVRSREVRVPAAVA
jgi:ABC-type transport system involved in multi-copper enzyme maturation permease subunit